MNHQPNDLDNLHYSSAENSFSSVCLEKSHHETPEPESMSNTASGSSSSSLGGSCESIEDTACTDSTENDSDNRVTFEQSEKGKEMVQWKNYCFHFKRNLTNNRKSWLCVQSYDKMTPCKVRLWTEGDRVVKVQNEHTHLASVSRVVQKAFKAKLN